MPLVKRLQEKYKDHQLTPIWIGFQDRPDKLRKFADNLGIHPVGYDDRDKVARSYGVSYGAGVIFIDSSGMVRKRVAKGFTEASLLKGLARIINTTDAPSQ
ncbi:TlpA family protein disulfide reductase [Nitrospirota bacterium]